MHMSHVYVYINYSDNLGDDPNTYNNKYMLMRNVKPHNVMHHCIWMVVVVCVYVCVTGSPCEIAILNASTFSPGPFHNTTFTCDP